MFSKSLIAPIFLLALTSSVNAHAGVTPALGVKGDLTRNDVQRPSQADPCGNINIAQNLDTSTTVNADANGSFAVNITDFNGGTDGSRSIQTVQVDSSGTGKNFVAATILKNGDPNPTTAGTEQLSVQLPAGIKCTGGTSKNLCLASFTTTAGFGNCVVISQGAGTGNDTTPPAKTDQITGPTNETSRVVDDAAAKNGTNSTDNTSPSNCTKTGQKNKTAEDDAVAKGGQKKKMKKKKMDGKKKMDKGKQADKAAQTNQTTANTTANDQKRQMRTRTWSSRLLHKLT